MAAITLPSMTLTVMAFAAPTAVVLIPSAQEGVPLLLVVPLVPVKRPISV